MISISISFEAHPEFRQGQSLQQQLHEHRRLVGRRSRSRAIGAACPWLRRCGDAGHLGPNLQGLAPGGLILGSGHLMAAKVKEVVDPIMGGQEALHLAG